MHDTIESMPDRRVIILGASNVVRGMSLILDSARNLWNAPLDVMIAAGHGRSYGASSRVLGRTLPGILDCGLWKAIEQRPSADTIGLITDIGNDILYGRSAEQISAWIDTCLDRLGSYSRQMIVTRLPMESIERVNNGRFLVMRTILFPRSRLTRDDAIRTARELDANIVQLAEGYGASVVTPQRDWYGIDPIHVTRRRQPAAWQYILRSCSDGEAALVAKYNLPQSLKLKTLCPETRNVLGIRQSRDQPAARMRDGSLLSLF